MHWTCGYVESCYCCFVLVSVVELGNLVDINIRTVISVFMTSLCIVVFQVYLKSHQTDVQNLTVMHHMNLNSSYVNSSTFCNIYIYFLGNMLVHCPEELGEKTF